MLVALTLFTLVGSRSLSLNEVQVECEGSFLTEAKNGVIERSIPLPAACMELSAKDGGYLVTMGDDNATIPWRSELQRQVGAPASERFIITGQVMTQRRKLTGEVKAIGDLQTMGKRDPTNPWIHYYIGKLMYDGGDKFGAMPQFEAALAHAPEYDFELVKMAKDLEAIDRTLADRAFDRGMKFLRHHGYDPELSMSLFIGVLLLGRTAPDADPARMAARWMDVGPRSEGISGYYAWLEKNMPDKALYADARRETARASFMGPLPWYAREAGMLLNLCMGGGIMLCLVVLARLIVRRRLQSPRAPLGKWTKAELVSVIGAVLVLAVSSWGLVRGISMVGANADVPMELAMGQLDHPLALRTLRAIRSNDASVRYLGIAYLLDGKLEEADKTFSASSGADAVNNRGIVALKKGNKEAARQLFEEALSKDKRSIAEYNLARLDGKTPNLSATDLRAFRMRRAAHYDLPYLLAVPTDDDYIALTQARMQSKHEASSPMVVLSLLASLDQVASRLADLPAFFMMMDPWLVLLFVLAIYRLVRGPLPSEEPKGAVRLIVGLLVPGSASGYGVFSAFIALAVGFLGLCSYIQWTSGFSPDILRAIATPSFEGVFGHTEPELPPLRSAWIWLGVLFAVNAVFVVTRKYPAKL
jgi:tetratricopeptide (TPR) repeat protein